MGTFIIIALIYVLGFFLSILALKKYGKQMGMADYDPPHGNWYDDYESNASAFMFFSIAWPLFWVICGIVGFFGALKSLIQKILDYEK
jgi:hypothetical protein